MNEIVAFICLALISPGHTQSALPLPKGIDLRVEHGTFIDPPPLGYYSYYVYNDSDDMARNVVLSCDIPAGAVFHTVTVDDERARCSAPAYGNRGHVEIGMPDMQAHGFVSVEFYLGYDGDPGSTAWMRLDAVSDDLDPNPGNNGYSYENYVAYPPPAPVLTGVTSHHDNQLGFVIIVTGQDLAPSYIHVGIGCWCEQWSQTLPRGDSIVLYGGKELRKKFPKGVPVQICVGYQGTPTGYILYTRP